MKVHLFSFRRIKTQRSMCDLTEDINQYISVYIKENNLNLLDIQITSFEQSTTTTYHSYIKVFGYFTYESISKERESERNNN